jgi:ubiquinone/menaquinone biosynthesis C-methylase UbiE
MAFYAERILPWLMGASMEREHLAGQRREALAAARGEILEIGFGAGASLAAYPGGGRVARLVGLEPSRGMTRRAAAQPPAPFPVEIVHAGAEEMPFEDGSFDTVVSTWTLCSVRDHAAVLRGIRRVLRPGGAFLFLEHGLAEDARLARWQRRLSWIHAFVAGGCRLDVPIDRIVRDGGFTVETLARYVSRPGSRLGSHMYRGAARPA